MSEQLKQDSAAADDRARKDKARLNIVYVSMLSVLYVVWRFDFWVHRVNG